MENSIKVIFTKEISITLSSDNPNIEEMMKVAIENKDKIDLEKITVDCEIDSFDSEGFKSIVKKSLETFYKDIELNKKELESILKKEASN